MYFPDMFACLSLCKPMYICLLITPEQEGQLSPSFQGVPGMVLCAKICVHLRQKFGEGVMGRGKKNWHFSFLAGPCQPCATVGT